MFTSVSQEVHARMSASSFSTERASPGARVECGLLLWLLRPHFLSRVDTKPSPRETSTGNLVVSPRSVVELRIPVEVRIDGFFSFSAAVGQLQCVRA